MAQPLEALGKGSLCSGRAEIEDGVEGRCSLEVLPGLRWRIRAQQASDFGGQDELLARPAAEGAAKALFRQPAAVQRSGVEEAQAGGPGAFYHLHRLFLGDLTIEAAEGGGAEAEPRHREPGPAEGHPLSRIHSA